MPQDSEPQPQRLQQRLPEMHRIAVKYFAADWSPEMLEKVQLIFHRWIQTRAIEGYPIDVADYRHVRNGPGVLLVGHDADYALDLSEGRPGLLYTLKRGEPGGVVESCIVAAFRGALIGCRALEAEPALEGRLRFPVGEALIVFQDRLRAPSGQKSFAKLLPAIEAAASRVYPGGIEVTYLERDPRQALAASVRAAGAREARVLLERLGAGG